MEIKITLDISDRLNAAIALIASALQARPTYHEKAQDLRVETPEPADVPATSPESDTKTDAAAHEISAASNEVVSEDAKPKRVRKKSDAPKAEPTPKTTEPPAEPEAVEAPKGDPKPAEAPKDDPKPAEAPKGDPKPAEAPKDEPAEAPKDDPATTAEHADAPSMTLDEIRAVCVQAAKAGKTNVVTGYLNARGAVSLSKLDPAFYPELADIVKAAL